MYPEFCIDIDILTLHCSIGSVPCDVHNLIPGGNWNPRELSKEKYLAIATSMAVSYIPDAEESIAVIDDPLITASTPEEKERLLESLCDKSNPLKGKLAAGQHMHAVHNTYYLLCFTDIHST